MSHLDSKSALGAFGLVPSASEHSVTNLFRSSSSHTTLKFCVGGAMMGEATDKFVSSDQKLVEHNPSLDGRIVHGSYDYDAEVTSSAIARLQAESDLHKAENGWAFPEENERTHKRDAA